MWIFLDVGSSVAALTGVGVALFVFGLTQYFVAVFVFLFFVCKKKQGEDLLDRFIFIYNMTSVLLFSLHVCTCTCTYVMYFVQ